MFFENLFNVPNAHSEPLSSLAFNPNEINNNILASSCIIRI